LKHADVDAVRTARQGAGMRRFSVLPLSLLLAVAVTAQDGPLLPERAGRIDELLAGEVRSGAYAGLSYVVYHGDRCVAHGAFGLADVERNRPLRRDALVRVYSMTKPITAVAALTLVEQDKLQLDQPIADFLPELQVLRVFTGGTADAPETAPALRPITVRMLLNHTAGFTYDFFATAPVHELYRRAGLWQARSTADFLQRVATLPLLAQPGTAWNYSIADDVLGVLIERVVKRPLDEHVRAAVTGPLGMADTGYDVAADRLPRLAVVHQRQDGRFAAAPASFAAAAEPGVGFPAGGAGMFSTLDDYARFGRFLLGDGSLDGVRVLSRATMDLLRTNTLRDGQRTSRPADGWGLATAVVVDPGAGAELMPAGALFWNGAATTSFLADPKNGVVAVLFAQHLPFDERRVIERFRTAVYQALR
jgi:CubicO group peptidase (beta-lactamase class C family)